MSRSKMGTGDHDHGHEHGHDHQAVPSDLNLRVKALESLLVEIRPAGASAIRC